MIKREQRYFVAETSFYASVSNAPHGAVSRSHFPPVINPRGGDVGMPQELLDLGDINLVLQRICRGGRPEGVRGHPPGQRDVCFLGVVSVRQKTPSFSFTDTERPPVFHIQTVFFRLTDGFLCTAANFR